MQAACEALAPHLFHVALTSGDPTGHVPIGFWMHRGCVPFVSHDTFHNVYWATLKPIIEELRNNPGVCQSWESKKTALPPINGDERLARQIWEQIDGLGNTFIWQILLSF